MPRFFTRELHMVEVEDKWFTGDSKVEVVALEDREARLDRWMNSFYPAEPVSLTETYREHYPGSGNCMGYLAMFRSP